MLGLRTTAGISRDLIAEFEDVINKNLSLGYLEETSMGFRLSQKGLDFANLVFMDFV